MSTRDSNLEEFDRESEDVRLAPLAAKDTVSLLQTLVNRLAEDDLKLFHQQDLQCLARAIHGHPLAAHNAIPFLLKHLGSYINPIEEFVRILDNGTRERRRVFFKFVAKGRTNRSLWDAFDGSLQLLNQEGDSENAVKFLQLLPYLRTDDDCIDFFLKTSKQDLLSQANISTHVALLRSDDLVVSTWLEILQDVSIFVSSGLRRSKRLDIHPLVLQFAQLLPSDEDMKHQTRDLLQLFYEFYQRQGAEHVIPHVSHCLDICSRFGISLQDLGLSPHLISWLQSFSTVVAQPTEPSRTIEMNNPFMQESDSIANKTKDFILLCARTQKKINNVDLLLGGGKNQQHLVLKCVGSFRELKGSLRHEDAYFSLQPLANQLEDAVGSLSEMVRSMSMYPELPHELDNFRGRCRALEEMSEGRRVVEFD